MVAAMQATIVHRGPDDAGNWAADGIALGMRRLSIIDLTTGRQPMTNEDGSQHIVYNGEIYNFQELRAALLNKGHTFSTSSDTEVILHQYEEDGPDCVQRFNGMFAFAIWDQTRRTLFLARDRLGVKPLYYYWDGRFLVFASEIKALLASGLVTRELNLQGLWDYLTFRYVPQPESMWRGVKKLLPGHTLALGPKDGEPVIHRYWDIPYGSPGPVKRPEEYEEEFAHLFVDAVKKRLIADVPVGILLSGGLDSSAVAAAIAQVHNIRLNSFSVAFRDAAATDELPYARQVAAQVGTKHHEIVIGAREFCDFLPRLVYYTDEPLADLAAVPLYYVSGLAREQVKVVLSGEGSDEILGGYHFDRTLRHWDLLRHWQRLPARLRETAARAVRFLGEDWARMIHRANTPWPGWLEVHPLNMTNYLTSEGKLAMFRETMALEDSLAQVQADVRKVRGCEFLHQLLYIYCQSWLVEDLLMKADKMTMAQSLELRVPFLDYRLVEWAARAPEWVKVKNSGLLKGYQTKWVLRRFARDRLPASVIARPKQGFPVPVYGWLRDRLKGWATSLLASADTRIYQWLEPEQVRLQLQRGTAANGSLLDRHRLWNLLILELWVREWQPQ
jgi:asparagine synthase (glutamine-hydrolysing)